MQRYSLEYVVVVAETWEGGVNNGRSEIQSSKPGDQIDSELVPLRRTALSRRSPVAGRSAPNSVFGAGH